MSKHVTALANSQSMKFLKEKITGAVCIVIFYPIIKLAELSNNDKSKI